MKATLQVKAPPPPHRCRYAGVLQILRFNYPMFLVAGLTAMIAASFLWFLKPASIAWWTVAVGLALGLWWAAATLAVSHLVYDSSAIFDFVWLRERLPNIRRWANVHAGFDQTTTLLRQQFPTATGTPIDLFDPAVMTERSIHRARAHSLPAAGTLAGKWNRLPLPDRTVDAVFMLFAAHELRLPEQRSTLFSEAARTLGDDGALVVVEHLRDPTNFVAFGPGAFHFHSRRSWLAAASTAHLKLVDEFPWTPYARIFIWRKQK